MTDGLVDAMCDTGIVTPDEARSLLAAIKASGFAVVPVEPTEAMCIAASKIELIGAGDIYGDGWVPPYQAPKVWAAMLSAAGDAP